MSSSIDHETFVANTDLSGLQYHFVINSASQKLGLAATAGAAVTGVLQTKPTSGKPASVLMTGKTKVFAGGTITGGGLFASTASGTATAVTSGAYIVGVALESVASGSLFDAFVTHAGYKG